MTFTRIDSEQVEVEEVIPRANLSDEQVGIEDTMLSSSSTSCLILDVFEVPNSSDNDDESIDEETTQSEATDHEVKCSPTLRVYEQQHRSFVPTKHIMMRKSAPNSGYKNYL